MAFELTQDEKTILVVGTVIVFSLIVYFELRFIRGKSKTQRGVNLRKDEAFNSILTCRSVINVLERQGTNVAEARGLVERAKRHMDRGEYESAIDLCERARDEMTKSREGVSGGARKVMAPRAEPSDLDTLAQEIVSERRPRPETDESYQGTRLEPQSGPSYLASKFEINTARDEISKARKEGIDVSKAADLLKSAQAEFDSGNYTKALSFAVKAKKAASPKSSDETIPLKKGSKPMEPEPEMDYEAQDVVDVCSSCGSSLDSEDDFCGSCGAKRSKARVCSVCGREASAGDKFCRKCGAKVD
jgi:hypothetical protein